MLNIYTKKLNTLWRSSEKKFKTLFKLAKNPWYFSNKQVLKMLTGVEISLTVSFAWVIALNLITKFTIYRDTIVV